MCRIHLERTNANSESYLDNEMEQVVDDFLRERLGPGYPLQSMVIDNVGNKGIDSPGDLIFVLWNISGPLQ